MDIAEEEGEDVSQSLLEYCKLDTFAMVELLRELQQKVENSNT